MTPLRLACLFFSIHKPVPFKKLNGTGLGELAGVENFSNLPRLHLIFVFIFYFYYIKINIFHKKIKIL